ncbi:mucin-5B-like [Pleurodeles waltl]|uniref:mucin-5B-like n=1 Tax=Pleurodeles waltl TaxID=8319 RepID=UPI0037099B1A
MPNNNLLCSTWGNSHFKTFDGDFFHFPGVCNYLFSSNCKSSMETFNVQLRRTVVDGLPTVSYITIHINGVFFVISKNSVRLAGNLVQLPYRRSWVEIKSKNNFVKVVANLGLILAWDQDNSIHLELDSKYANLTCGLCGDFNGVAIYDEFITNGVQLSPYAYALSQKVEGPTDTCEERPMPAEAPPCFDTDNVCNLMMDSIAFSECQGLVGAYPFVETCTQDLCRCNSSERLLAFCICNTVIEYSRQCADGGGKPRNWRTPEMCPMNCPPGMEYKECGPWDSDRCSSHGGSIFQRENCLDGCFCSKGTVFDDISSQRCIPPDRCPCTYNGVVYPPGETYSNRCHTCKCNKGEWFCEALNCPGFCSIEGGSHISTYDELSYNFHGDCNYVLSQLCGGRSFYIIGELKKCGQTDIETCLNAVIVVTEDSTVIDIDSKGLISVNRTHMQLPVIAGLCGDFNSIQGDEFTGTSGMVEGTAAAFANSWKVYPQCPDIRNIFDDPCLIHSEKDQYAHDSCDLLIQPDGPFASCHPLVNPRPYNKNCIFDTCVCKNTDDCFCAALSSYVRACAIKGLVLSKWRSNVCILAPEELFNASAVMKSVDFGVFPNIWEGCSLEGAVDDCPELGSNDLAGLVEDVVGARISRQCISGCICPTGMVLDGSGGCVLTEQCPCIHNGEAYQQGDTIQVSCNTCTCTNKSWSCTNRLCLGSCTTYGEGNYVTFDNRRFRFSGNCEYILTQDYCSSSTHQGTFSVIIENVPCSTSGITCAKALKLSLGSYMFTFRDAQFKVEDTRIGKRVPYKIRYMGIYLVVEGSNGMILLWDKKTTIFVKLTTVFTGVACGLCGNFDGNSLNDFTTRSLSVVEDVLEFGDSWKFSSFCKIVDPPRVPCLDNPPRRFWAQKQCSIILSATFADCQRQVNPVPYYDVCVTDSCACDIGGDCECFCTAVAAYAQACSDNGICVNWRSPEICPLFCDYYNSHGDCDWHYQPCGAPCLKTCRNPTGQCLYVLPPLEGCYPRCPTERPFYDEDRKQCVAKCGCYDDEENRYEFGEKVDLCVSCQICNCTMNGIECAYDVRACFCVFNGKVYGYQEIIYSKTDKMGRCINVTCGADGNTEIVVYSCLTTERTTTSAETGCVYEVCEWSPWYDVSYPQPGPTSGDFESFANLRAKGYAVCDAPKQNPPVINVINCSNSVCEMTGNRSIMSIRCPPVIVPVCIDESKPAKVYNEDACCFHYVCKYCTGPDGQPKVVPEVDCSRHEEDLTDRERDTVIVIVRGTE